MPGNKIDKLKLIVLYRRIFEPRSTGYRTRTIYIVLEIILNFTTNLKIALYNLSD